MSLRRLFALFGTTALLSGCALDVGDARPDRTDEAASAVAQNLSIPTQMPSVTIDFAAHTATFPLHRAHGPDHRLAYFILTDTSDLAEAVRLGINWSPKLTHALGTAAVQHAEIHRRDQGDEGDEGDEGDDSLGFTVRLEGGVDFAPHRVVVPGPDLFPLGDGTAPGSIGDAKYSPLFAGRDHIVYNGPQIANASGVHDKAITIDYEKMTATMRLTAGFYNGRDVLYLSTDASVPPIAALEAATYAPNLASAPEVGVDDPAVSAREPIIPIVNGPMGVDNPERQGLRSAVAGEGDPLNIIREEPECSDPSVPASCSALEYSPLWDVHPVLWTQAAIDGGLRHRVTAHQDVEALFNAGQLVSAAPGGPSNQDPEIQGLRAAGVVVNCPPVFVAP